MKLDGEPGYRVSESNESKDNQMDVVTLKADNEIRMEWKQGFTSFAEYMSCKKVTDPSQLGDGDKPGSRGFKNDSSSDSQEEGGHVISPLSVPIPQSEKVKKETNFYTDKAVTEVELPQMIICFKEGSYHVIKDICVDEGFHSFEKVLVENEVDNRRVDNIFHSATDGSKYLFNEKPVLCGLKYSDLNEPPVIDVEKEVAKETSSKNLEGGEKFDTIDEAIDELSKEKIIASELLVLQDLDIDHCQMHSSSTESNSGIPQSVGGASACYNSNQEQSDEVAMDKSSESKDFPSNSKEESGSITFDFDAGPPAISATIQSKGKTEHQQSVQVITKSESEEASVDALTASARSSFVHHGYADSIFPGPASLSSSIAYSGQIPYSGNISLRSDSSTTSTHSFAFPILQTEWNSSPVKMAKADRRLYRKHRSWMLGLLCCRF